MDTQNKRYYFYYTSYFNGAGDGNLVNSFLSGKYFTSAKACRSICPHIIELARLSPRLRSTEFTLEPSPNIYLEITKELVHSSTVIFDIKTVLKFQDKKV